MGKVDIKCFTSDSGLITLYEFGFGFSSTNAHTTRKKDEMVLFKSQPNPFNMTDLKWSTVSTFPTSTELTSMVTRDYPEVACAINSAGVFTALAYSDARDDERSTDTLQGIRYNPAGQMEPEYNVTGGGVWSTLDVEPSYNQTDRTMYLNQKLFYATEGGKETLYHAHADYTSTIYLGYLNETGSRPLLQHSTTFKNDTLRIPSISSLAYGNNQLFAYSSGPRPSMIATSLPNRTSSSKPTIKRFATNETTDCQYEYMDVPKGTTWKDSYFLLCNQQAPIGSGRPSDSRLETITSMFTDTKMTTVTRYTGILEQIWPIAFFQPVGGHMPGQVPFAVIDQRQGVLGIILTGPTAGTVQNYTDVCLEGVYGDGFTLSCDKAPPSSTPTPSIPSGSWVAIGGSVIVVTLAALFAR
ncbi:hypothetical protein BGX33_004561 [Mortierella sp. NVP41]|nr:hypothetical protein BGX33_004561 [Mortierella sp. NVP41]